MKSFVDVSVSKKCYAVMWSYGEICVGCNCCGRIEKGLKMWEARLNYHKEELERNLNFNQWAYDYPELMRVQKENMKQNISYEKSRIRYCKKAINRIKNTKN